MRLGPLRPRVEAWSLESCSMLEPTILVHGGAGHLPPAARAIHEQGCRDAAAAGGAILVAGGNAVQAVCAAVEALEANPVYNAGVGCALTSAGKVSLDTALMCGHSLRAAGLACLGPFLHPIRIAEQLLPEPEVLLAGPEAELWAERRGFKQVSEEQMITEKVRQVWHEVVHNGGSSNFAGGTVGAVCRDAEGHMAAGTSTGGSMGKPPGRVGDSPLIGAGTFADEKCAVSATGVGESFIRSVFAGQVACAIRDGLEPESAMYTLLERVRDVYQGEGGAILLTVDGPPLALRTTETMAWAWWTPSAQGSGV
jgi:L-asparaginase / beta-aspartyl-peptidase